MVTTVSVREAKTHLSRLLARVEAGEEIVIARRGRPIARLQRLGPAVLQRRPGNDRVIIHPDFDDPIPDTRMGPGLHAPRRSDARGREVRLLLGAHTFPWWNSPAIAQYDVEVIW